MRNEETLRKALSLYEQLRDLSYDTGYYAACMGQVGDKTYAPLHADAVAKRNKITRKMAAALDATAGDPQMDQLVEWLEREQRHTIIMGTAYAYQAVLDHIREGQP